MTACTDRTDGASPALERLEIELDRVLFRVVVLGGLPEVERSLREARRLLVRAACASPPSVAVVGASTDRSKFGNKAVRAHRGAGFRVYPVHPNAGRVEGLRAYASLDDLPVDRLDRVSLYVPPAVGLGVLEQAARKEVGEIWLNPGADAPEVVARARALGLNVVQACSILAAGVHPDRL
jgi:predicted CoA-binding protein